MAICENNVHGDNPSPAAEENKKQQPHVLVVPWPGQGHINPMMHLSNHLAANGVIITFANTQFNHNRIIHSQASRADTRNPDSESIDHVKENLRLVGVPDGLGHEEYVVNSNIHRKAQALIDMEPLLVKLVEMLEPPITCIIADVFVISTPAVARRFDIPHVTFWTQSAACYATHVYFTQNHAFLKEQMEGLQNKERRVIGSLPGCPELSHKEVPTFLQPCDPSDFLFSYVMTNFESAKDNAYVLINTLEELEAESLSFIHRPNMLCIGPLLPPQFLTPSLSTRPLINKLDPSFWIVDHEGCMPWLHQQSPSSVLYVSFGSTTLMPAQQASEFAAGLEASGSPFLMVVRPEMLIDGASVTFPHGFVDRMRASGRAAFVQWAPQLEVLAHPAIGGFLTHAGWNSTLESLCLGVPMLCWPFFGDQMLNTRCIVDTWKIGFTLAMNNVMGREKFTRTGGGASDISSSSSSSNGNDSDGNMVALVTSEEIERKVRQLMDPFTSKDIRKRVHTLSLAAKKKASEGSSFRTLLDFLFD